MKLYIFLGMFMALMGFCIYMAYLESRYGKKTWAGNTDSLVQHIRRWHREKQ